MNKRYSLEQKCFLSIAPCFGTVLYIYFSKLYLELNMQVITSLSLKKTKTKAERRPNTVPSLNGFFRN